MSKDSKRTGTRAIYPGTFDPITNGHVDVIQRALEVFETITILVAHSGKKAPLFESEERKALIEKCFENNPRIKVDIYDGLLVDYAKKNEIKVGHPQGQTFGCFAESSERDQSGLGFLESPVRTRKVETGPANPGVFEKRRF